MRHLFEITSESSANDCLSKAFQFIAENFYDQGNPAAIDLKDVSYASPFFIAPILAFFKQEKKTIDFDKLSPSLQDICFPNGLNAYDLSPLLLKSKLNAYLDKAYLPIISFNSKSSEEYETASVIGMVESTLYAQMGHVRHNITNGLRYVIGEIIDNVSQHSHSGHGYFFSNINREKNYVDIAILDEGIGLLGSYSNNNDADIASDIEALQAANRGISTKNLPNAENRGFGIITSKKMVIDGLNGIYAMISGNAMLIKTSSFNQYFELSSEIKFKGTIVIFRLPLVAENFNYVSYIE